MTRVLSLFVVVVLMGLCLISNPGTSAHIALSSARPKPAVNAQYVDGQVLVKMRSGSGVALEAARVADELLPAANAHSEPLNAETVGQFVLVQLAPGASVEEAVAKLSADPRVEYAEPNYLWRPADTIPNDPDFLGFPGPMWGLLNLGNGTDGDTGLAGIEAPRAWDITTGSGNVVVAVTDEGVDISHQDLQANVWVNPSPGKIAGFENDINGWNFIDNNNVVFDPATDGNHGTHVSGTIGAVGDNAIGVTGVAWHCQLMSLKFIGTDSSGQASGSTHNAVRAIDYAIKQKKRGINVRVINASWDGPNASQGLHDAIVAAGKAGIVFVCAAGNSDSGAGKDMDVPRQADYPGAWNTLSNVISVAALDKTDNLAGYSQFGHRTVTLAAPGGAEATIQNGVLSTLPGNQYGPDAGTSMASPHVAGIAVLLADHEPNLTPVQIKQRILSTAQPVLALASKTASSGRADAFLALSNQLAPAPSPVISAVSTTTKALIVDGLGFHLGNSVIYVNGTLLPIPQYDQSFVIGNGTLTRLTVKLGKSRMASTFPAGTPVSIQVLNPTVDLATGVTSPPFSFVNQ